MTMRWRGKRRDSLQADIRAYSRYRYAYLTTFFSSFSPLAPASSESYSGPLHNLLPPRCCVCTVKSLIAVSRRKCVIHSHTCNPSIFMGFRIHSSVRSTEYIFPYSWWTGVHPRRPLFFFSLPNSIQIWDYKRKGKKRKRIFREFFQNEFLLLEILRFPVKNLKEFGKILAIHPSVD